jgi:hypothetical protein
MKVTIYIGGSFGVSKHEATLIDHGRQRYAQYEAAPFVTFTPRGKRKARSWAQGYHPYLLILAGHGHPDPQAWLVPAAGGDQVSRYSSCDPRWETDFDAQIDPYVAANPGVVVADYRHTKPAPAAVAAAQ